MIARQPYLPRWVGGGPGNPLGARALYLGSTDYRIHGTNDPASIGTQVSSGCIRLRNADVIDLYRRVSVGTKVLFYAGIRARGKRYAGRCPPGVAVAHNGAGVMTARIFRERPRHERACDRRFVVAKSQFAQPLLSSRAAPKRRTDVD